MPTACCWQFPRPLRHLVGSRMHSPGVQEALHERRPLVSTPYVSVANNLVVALSQPIFDSNGRYLGYVGGSLYLRERNILNSLLGEHFTRTVPTCTWSTATAACCTTLTASGWAPWSKAMH